MIIPFVKSKRKTKEAVCASSSLSSFSFHDDDDDAAIAEAIYEVEVLIREPQEVLEELQERLSTKDLQSILLYFSQEGRDIWYALEIFDWMKMSGRAEDEETRDLMMSIMSKWLMRLVGSDLPLNDVKNILQDMICVGLRPDPDILQSLVIAYWDKGLKEHALDLALDNIVDDEHCLVSLMWRMIHSNDQSQAVDLVFRLRMNVNSSKKISFGIYNIALLAVLFEQKQLTKVVRDLYAYHKKGAVELKESDEKAIREYENKLHKKAEQIATWALEDHRQVSDSSIYKKLLAMYCISGRGLEATQTLWNLKRTHKHTQKPIQAKLFNTVLGICAYGNHPNLTRVILNMMKDDGHVPDKKSYAAIFGGFANGGHIKEAIHVFIEMLDQGLLPDNHLTLSAMRQINKVNDIQLVYKFGKSVVQAQLVDPFVVYIDIDQLNLSIILLL